MRAIFIADAHLKGLNDPNQKHLCSFLKTLKDVDILFVLGDLFEFWTGCNKTLEYNYSPVLAQFKRLKESGTNIIYVEGNHDFSVGPFFKDILGGAVYPDSADITLDGKRFFLAHGDIVEHSVSYKIWRRLLRSSITSVIIKMIPHAFVWRAALWLAKTSHKNHKIGDRLDKLQKSFAKEKITQDFDVVIFAHSHVPEVSEIAANGKNGVYANPGDWVGEFSYLVYEDGNIRLERYNE
ncbi:MAG: UDP-2,3-diacylglucosamine diphosphatase [Deltaproteobacteria bacterium]